MITFLGDVALIADHMESDYKPDGPYTFNLEYVIGDRNTLCPIPNKINLCSVNHDFDRIFGSSPLAVNVVNNHIYDYGEEGYRNTLDLVQGKNIQIITDEPTYLSDKLCVFSYIMLSNYSEFSFDRDAVEKNIQMAREKNPNIRIVVQMHWGIENHPMQTASQTKVAHQLIDMGVDLVIGHHPHCLQPVEKYNGKYIFYSLGNGLFGNINQPSHYDKNGTPSRVYRFKWQKWNRRSIAVIYDEDRNEVIGVDRLYQKKNKLICVKKNVLPDTMLKHRGGHGSNLKFKLRKYGLFFASNSFVDKKLFDFRALKHELGRTK